MAYSVMKTGQEESFRVHLCGFLDLPWKDWARVAGIPGNKAQGDTLLRSKQETNHLS